jgi:hypothetical protein
MWAPGEPAKFHNALLFVEMNTSWPVPIASLKANDETALVRANREDAVDRAQQYGAAQAQAGQAAAGPRSPRSVYGLFTEGFDTLDLKEAKTLLDELHD